MVDESEPENEYLSLPADPEEAFAVLHRRKIKEIEAAWQDNNHGNMLSRAYIDTMIAFNEVHNLDLLGFFDNVPSRESDFYDYFENFRRHCEITSQKILMESARRTKANMPILVLDAPARSAVHHLIERIREKLNEINFPESKREALFNKLNDFAAEVDRNRTRAESFYAFAIDAARAAREINDEIKPLQQTIDRVFDWLDKAKKWGEMLPPWKDRKKIEGPQKQIGQGGSRSPLDDDIPF